MFLLRPSRQRGVLRRGRDGENTQPARRAVGGYPTVQPNFVHERRYSF